MRDCTEDIQNLVNQQVPIDLAAYNGCEIGSVSLPDGGDCILTCSDLTRIYMKGLDLTKGAFDLQQDAATTRRFGKFLLSGEDNLIVDGQGAARHFFMQRVYDDERGDIPGLRLQRTTDVLFLNFNNAGGIRVQNATKSTVSGCCFFDIRGTGKGHTFASTMIDEPCEIATIDCFFLRCNAPTGQSSPTRLKHFRKTHPAKIACRQLYSKRQLGRWKLHGDHSIAISGCIIRANEGNHWGGFNVPTNFWHRGVHIKDSAFEGFHAAVTAGAGLVYDRGVIVLENVTASDCNWLGAISARNRCFAFGKMKGNNLRKGVFSATDAIEGTWTEEVTQESNVETESSSL